jgi:hypothetical protein
MIEKKYTAGSKNYEHKQENGDCWWGVTGRDINGELGYYSHTMNPHLSMKTKEEAERSAEIANITYEVGYRQAQHDIRKSLGIK